MDRMPLVDVAIWGASPDNPDNGPALDAAFRWSATVGGARLVLPAGRFSLKTTFDCHGASGTSLEGVGNTTILYRDTNYGSTMTCSGAQSIRVASLWALHDLGPDPATHFLNPTVDSAHFDFRDVNHFEFDHVTAWNMNYNFRIITSIEGIWRDPFTYGYYDDVHPQTIASILFDGADGTGLGHPQLMRIEDPQFGSSLLEHRSVVVRGARIERTLPDRQIWRGPRDHVLVRSIEDLQIRGGIGGDASYATLHLAPAGDLRRPILKVSVDGLFLDGGGVADVAIDNDAAATCNDAAAAHNVRIANSFLDGELVGLYGIYVPGDRGCVAVEGLSLNNLSATAHVRTPFFLSAVDGVSLTASVAAGYDALGVVADDVALSSAVWISHRARNVVVDGFAAGGGPQGQPIDPAHPPGTAPYTASQARFGVSIEAGAENVVRRNVVNMGYAEDYRGAAPSTACGKGCTATTGSDNQHGRIVTTPQSGPVTAARVAYSGPLSPMARPDCSASDAQTAGGMPVAAAARDSDAKGFSVVFAADIGGGGSFGYTCR